MKKIIATGKQKNALTLSLGLSLGGSLALAFWFATSPNALGQDGNGMCPLCHKGSQNLSIPCGTLEYRRHVDHGDRIGGCDVTPVSNP